MRLFIFFGRIRDAAGARPAGLLGLDGFASRLVFSRFDLGAPTEPPKKIRVALLSRNISKYERIYMRTMWWKELHVDVVYVRFIPSQVQDCVCRRDLVRIFRANGFRLNAPNSYFGKFYVFQFSGMYLLENIYNVYGF